MSHKIVSHSDLTLTEGDPTERAVIHIQLEKVELKGELLGGNAFELEDSALPGRDGHVVQQQGTAAKTTPADCCRPL